ncbi:unnamed protein product, partial [Coregonus sp. 'balchen']
SFCVSVCRRPLTMQPSTMDPSTTKLIQPTVDLTITQLNQECLLHLLSYLDKDSCRSLSLTCHRLRQVYLDPRLWSLLLFRSPSELRRDNYVLGPSLRYLAVTWHSSRVKVCNVEDWMKNQFQKDLCRKHESLVSSFLERSCSRLRSLRLENCVRVTDLTLQALVLHGAGLHQVTVDFCRNVTQAGLETVRERRPDIRLTAERSAGMIPDIKPDKRTQQPVRRRLLQK